MYARLPRLNKCSLSLIVVADDSTDIGHATLNSRVSRFPDKHSAQRNTRQSHLPGSEPIDDDDSASEANSPQDPTR